MKYCKDPILHNTMEYTKAGVELHFTALFQMFLQGWNFWCLCCQNVSQKSNCLLHKAGIFYLCCIVILTQRLTHFIFHILQELDYPEKANWKQGTESVPDGEHIILHLKSLLNLYWWIRWAPKVLVIYHAQLPLDLTLSILVHLFMCIWL